ncbi:UPF0415 protein C7orf25 homolog isoform X2 [Portunus trituberculatus]|uniref:UPF0415 protein C7orf25 homolog isoform X2 n=1 Tax=Portunus trituberculatus TaxID=210409 RepID=UPI001E1CC119|nr:UPF0415 protein C7orf25 homolog isoform X2 [Portunus trituberculatus]
MFQEFSTLHGKAYFLTFNLDLCMKIVNEFPLLVLTSLYFSNPLQHISSYFPKDMAADLAVLKIREAHNHLEKIAEFEKRGINGAQKLKKRILAEIKFLQKGLQNSEDLKEKDVLCSNLGQLGALADVAIDISDVTGILQSFRNEENEKIIIDIVADNGMKWIKVIMRNPKALHLLFVLGRRGNAKPLNEVAEDFKMYAKLHPVFYSSPKVIFWFCNGVSEGLARSIEDKGVAVEGRRIADEDLGLPDFSIEDSDTEIEESSSTSYYSDGSEKEEIIFDKSKDPNTETSDTFPEREIEWERASISLNLDNHANTLPIENADSGFIDQSALSLSELSLHDSSGSGEQLGRINLDVTAMIAYVSSTANEGANFIFQDKFLNEQAACERKNPVKKTLDGYFKGRELVACKEAVDRFQEIVSVIGGEGEKTRAKELLARLTVVPGQDFFKDKIKAGGKIRALPRMTFGTGQAMRAITVTSNMGFVRAAHCQKGSKKEETQYLPTPRPL